MTSNPPSRRSIPIATYRLQLTPTFTLDDAAKHVPYLSALGISHVYTSPYLQAGHGSTHGYDTVNHDRVNPELGGEEARQLFVDALRAHGMSHVIDVVPTLLDLIGIKAPTVRRGEPTKPIQGATFRGRT